MSRNTIANIYENRDTENNLSTSRVKKWKQFCILFKVLTNWDESPFSWKMHGVHYLISFFLQRIAFWMFSTNMIIHRIRSFENANAIWKLHIAKLNANGIFIPQCFTLLYHGLFFYVLCRIINITISAT